MRTRRTMTLFHCFINNACKFQWRHIDQLLTVHGRTSFAGGAETFEYLSVGTGNVDVFSGHLCIQ